MVSVRLTVQYSEAILKWQYSPFEFEASQNVC